MTLYKKLIKTCFLVFALSCTSAHAVNDCVHLQNILQEAVANVELKQPELKQLYQDAYKPDPALTSTIECMNNIATNGNSIAQQQLGMMYFLGIGTTQNYELAREWLEKAALQDNDDAQFTLSSLYTGQYGISQDDGKFIYWLRKSAALGNAAAWYSLKQLDYDLPKGASFNSAKGKTKVLPQSLNLLRTRAKNGQATAQYKLGMMYIWDEGIAHDYDIAHDWLEKSALQDNPDAQLILNYYYKGEFGSQEDIPKATYWLEKSANLGNSRAEYIFGNAYLMGTGVEKDYTKALKWFKKSYAQNYADARFQLTQMCKKGLGMTAADQEMCGRLGKESEIEVKKWIANLESPSRTKRWSDYDTTKPNIPLTGANKCIHLQTLLAKVSSDIDAKLELKQLLLDPSTPDGVFTPNFQCLQKFAAKGSPIAQQFLGTYYYSRVRESQNSAKAIYWYQKAAKQGLAGAIFALGSLHRYGDGVLKDYNKALMLFQLNAEYGEARAQYELGMMYFQGLGTVRNYALAHNWLEKAALQDNDEAQLALSKLYTGRYDIPKDDSKFIYWLEKAAKLGNSSAMIELNKRTESLSSKD